MPRDIYDRPRESTPRAYTPPRRARRRRRRRRRGLFWLAAIVVLALVLVFRITGGREDAVSASPDGARVTSDPTALEAALAEADGGFSPSDEDLAALRETAEANPGYRESIELFIEYIACYSQEAVNTVLLSPEKTDFVLCEPFAERTGDVEPIDATRGEVPFLLQYDSRWAFHEYGSSVMGYTGCGPTCLSMAAIGLTGDGSLTPVYVADMALEQGYYVYGTGTSWTLFTEGAASLGLSGEVIPLNEAEMKARLDGGEVLVLSMTAGDFTKNGHFIVAYAYGGSGFHIYDPSSTERSAKSWSFEALEGQTAQVWSLSAGE